jgi:hypothetical protein
MKTKHDWVLYLIIAVGIYLCHGALIQWLDKGMI